jgi:murein L,D-transpeptidase YcbB/YkuD
MVIWRQRLLAITCALTMLALSPVVMSAETSVTWVVQGRPTALAKSAVKILEQAGDEGLNPSDYDASTLSKDVAEASQGAPLSVAKQTELDSAITQSMLRYLHDLHYGRVDPRTVYANFDVPPKTLNLQATLNAAVAAGDLSMAVKGATPSFPLYKALRPWLVTYRALEGNPAWSGNLPALPVQKLEPGAAYDGVGLLAARLVS